MKLWIFENGAVIEFSDTQDEPFIGSDTNLIWSAEEADESELIQ